MPSWKGAPQNFAVRRGAVQSETVEARVVGGRAALLLWSALCACDIAPSVPAAPVDLSSSTESEPAPSEAPTAEVLPPSSASEPAALPSASRVVLVTIDGVRWEDVFDASSLEPAMPNLQRLVGERGVALGGPDCEHDVRASGPNFVSLPGYLEIFTGSPTACTHNHCPPVETPTVIDEARGAAARDGDVAVFSSWGKYAHAAARDRRAIVLSAGAHGIGIGAAKEDAKLRSWLEAGSNHAGYPGSGDYRPDVHTARIALRYLETQAPRLLVIGLGDADEYAHRGDVAGYRRSIRRADDVLAELDRTLARMGGEGAETAVVVTTDHGRARSLRGHGASFPESQRVFVAAFGAGVARRGVACASEPLRLAHLAGAVRSLLALETDAERGPLADEIVANGRAAAVD
jgi:Metalloenzyme superfamily